MGIRLKYFVVIAFILLACSLTPSWLANARAQSSNLQPGDVVLFDDLSDSTTGVLPTSSNQQSSARYAAGEYVIQKLPGQGDTIARVSPPGQFDDHSIEVDARILPDTSERAIILECRWTGSSAGNSGYRVQFWPRTGQLGIFRIDAGKSVDLSTNHLALVANRGDSWNHLSLNCVGSTISVSLNAALVAQAQDANYASGRVNLGTLSQAGSLFTEAHFRNLQITYQPPIPAGTPAVATNAAPGTVLLSDSMTDASQGILPASQTGLKSGNTSYDAVYENGGYVIRTANAADATSRQSVDLPGIFSNSSLVVDASLSGDNMDRDISLRCRGGSGGSYLAFITPRAQYIELFRRDADKLTLLVGNVSPAVRRGGQVNHLELLCVGTTIALAVNGTTVAAVKDDRYATGTLDIATAFNKTRLGDEARFQNLMVTYPTPDAVGTVQVPEPGTTIIADNFLSQSDGALPVDANHQYIDGEYSVHHVPNGPETAVDLLVGGEADLVFDARVAGTPTERAGVEMGCQVSKSGGYDFGFVQDGGYSLVRFDGDKSVSLAKGVSPAIKGAGSSNQVEFICAGGYIVVRINGQLVAQVQDATYEGVGNHVFFRPFSAGPVEVRIKNLAITVPDIAVLTAPTSQTLTLAYVGPDTPGTSSTVFYRFRFSGVDFLNLLNLLPRGISGAGASGQIAIASAVLGAGDNQDTIIVGLSRSIPAGTYTVTLTLPDGRHAQASFDHNPYQ
jgi:Domain of Unknown Function (DUF1080)